ARSGASLRPTDADDLRHPLQLLVAGTRLGRAAVGTERWLFLADPELQASLLAALVSAWRLASGMRGIRRGSLPRPAGAHCRHILRAACDVAAGGSARVPKRGASIARREL